MNISMTRRTVVRQASMASIGLALSGRRILGDDRASEVWGGVVGEPTAEKIGHRVLVDGGNAIDAIIAAALTAAVAAPNQTGIGGYGMSAIVAVEDGTKIFCIDGNSAAPAAMTKDTFRSTAEGNDPSRRHTVGWLAASVPGILGGLQLMIDRFASRSFEELVQPAILLARTGFPWTAPLAAAARSQLNLATDPGSRKLYFRGGKPLEVGAVFQNVELAELLESLAEKNSVDAFYRGDIAQRIADAFRQNGGLLTIDDLHHYEARCVEAISVAWDDCVIHTPPLTSGGLTMLQILQTLRAMQWTKMSDDLENLHAKIEATRAAWHDRLTLLGDPAHVDVPMEKLLSSEYAQQKAEMILDAVKRKSFLRYPVQTKTQPGTINLSAVDRNGNMAVLTLTHGESFGAKITVDGLGLTLGHGMSRFDPHPDHPNAPGPSKRPLHNMVPTIVTRAGKSLLAVGGRGGRKIVNAVLESVLQSVAMDQKLSEAIAAPRWHTEGTEAVSFERRWPSERVQQMASLGYTTKTEASATLSAVANEDGRLLTAMR